MDTNSKILLNEKICGDLFDSQLILDSYIKFQKFFQSFKRLQKRYFNTSLSNRETSCVYGIAWEKILYGYIHAKSLELDYGTAYDVAGDGAGAAGDFIFKIFDDAEGLSYSLNPEITFEIKMSRQTNGCPNWWTNTQALLNKDKESEIINYSFTMFDSNRIFSAIVKNVTSLDWLGNQNRNRNSTFNKSIFLDKERSNIIMGSASARGAGTQLLFENA